MASLIREATLFALFEHILAESRFDRKNSDFKPRLVSVVMMVISRDYTQKVAVRFQSKSDFGWLSDLNNVVTRFTF